MSELDLLRGAIDEVDRQIVTLFERRMEVTQRVGEYKKQVGMPVLDPKRERDVLQKKIDWLHDPELKTDVTTLYETIMALSRKQQRKLVHEGTELASFARYAAALADCREPVEHPRVVYQGEPGAYSEMAAIDFFGPDVAAKGLYQFEDPFEALRKGEADYAVLPIENSSTGAIRQVYDLLAQYQCYIVGETTVRVRHCLMALPGTKLEDIDTVYSHEQGLFQCEQFLNQYPHWRRIAQADTAGSAKLVAEQHDPTKAAICSTQAAELYGLEILAEGVNSNSQNTTRFVVISPKMELREGRDKVCISFTTPHESGSLHEVLTIFAVHGLNLVRLESRPIPEHSWEYMFFTEFLGNLTDPEMDGVMHELTQTTEDLRVFGNFQANLD
ncbi:MAG: prephenate dehydratase [Oscillospiraceae bacterium]|nr:prephenate dehydratase [Oscillospiraceae bacterium]